MGNHLMDTLAVVLLVVIHQWFSETALPPFSTRKPLYFPHCPLLILTLPPLSMFEIRPLLLLSI
jgi:hypothetical protein